MAKDTKDRDALDKGLIRDLAQLLNETGLTEIEIEKASTISSSQGGSGRIRITRIPITPSASVRSPRLSMSRRLSKVGAVVAFAVVSAAMGFYE